MVDRGLPSLILITGGVRSGKSTFAEQVTAKSGKRIIYLATAEPGDEEMKKRISEHRQRRSSDVLTVEEYYSPHVLFEKESSANNILLLDCLTVLLSNRLLNYLELHREKGDSNDVYNDKRLLEAAANETMEYVRFLADCAQNTLASVVVVTNEVGMGVVPDYSLGRAFRDLAGKANQHFAAAADQVWLVVCGIPRQIK